MSAQIQRWAGATELPFSSATKADGLVYVAGTIVAEGDVRNQTRQVLQNIDATLQKAGSSLANAASVHVYLKTADDFAAMNEVYRTFWKADPPVRTTIAADFVVPNALVEISVVAVPTGGPRQVIHPAAWMKSPNPYSYGIKSGNTLFLSGLVARNGKDNSIVPGDMTVQTKAVLDNGAEILKAAGMGFEHVVSSRVFITDVKNFQAMNDVYRTYFTKDPPARATVVSPLMGPQFQVEVTMTAVNAPKQTFTTPAADGTPGQAEPDPEQRRQGRQPALRLGDARQHARDQGQHGGADQGDPGPHRPHADRRRLRLGGPRRRHRLHHRHGAVQRDEHRLSIVVKELPARATVRAGLVNADGLVEIMFVASK